MARLVFGMNQSLDGYVDHTAFAPGPALFRHSSSLPSRLGLLNPSTCSTFPSVAARKASTNW